MQKVLEFKKRNFWSNKVDLDLLNEKITTLNSQGWIVESLCSNTTILGFVISYTLLMKHE